MLSEHEDKPCYCVAHNWTFLEKQVWVWILRDIKWNPSHKYRNPGDRFECNRSSQYLEVLSKIRGLTLILPPALCHSWWFRSGSLSAGWGIIPSTTLLDYKKKKKSQVIHVCVCYKWIDFIRCGRFLYPTLCRLELAYTRKIYCGFLSWLFLISFGVLPFLVIDSQQLCHFCVPRQ